MKKINKNELGFGIVWIILVIVFVAIVIISTALVTKSSADCDRRYNLALSAAQSNINEFNKIALLGEQPVQNANIQRSGDCVDSSPYVTVSKTYSKIENGGIVEDGIRLGLKNSGYTITSEDFGSEGYKLHYKVLAQNNDIKIYAVASQEDIKDSTCNDGYPKGVSQAHFRSQKIDYIKLRLL